MGASRRRRGFAGTASGVYGSQAIPQEAYPTRHSRNPTKISHEDTKSRRNQKTLALPKTASTRHNLLNALQSFVSSCETFENLTHLATDFTRKVLPFFPNCAGKKRSAVRTAEKYETFVGVGIGIDQQGLRPGIIKPQRPFDPDSDTDPDTDNHGMHQNVWELFPLRITVRL
jgi:hypothetical protein